MVIELQTTKIDLKVLTIQVDLLDKILQLFIIQGILGIIIKMCNILKCIQTILKQVDGSNLLLRVTVQINLQSMPVELATKCKSHNLIKL